MTTGETHLGDYFAEYYIDYKGYDFNFIRVTDGNICHFSFVVNYYTFGRVQPEVDLNNIFAYTIQFKSCYQYILQDYKDLANEGDGDF